MQKVTEMREEEVNNMEWIDREEWRRKIKLQARKDGKTLTLCTQINNYFVAQYFYDNL